MAPPLDLASLPAVLDQQQRSLFDDNLWRESVRQPLYSSAGVSNAALPNVTPFFGYGRGANVPGVGNAAGVPSTLFHTNMEQAGVLESPKKFRCDGVRLYMPPLAFNSSNVPAISDPSFGTAAVDDELLEDWLTVLYSTVLWLQIGQKTMIEHPSWFLPANVGVGGLAAVSQDNGTAATTGSLNVCIPHSIGKSMDFRVAPFLIDQSQQTIRCELRAPISSVALNDPRLITVYLQGNYWRGVQ